MLRHAGAVLGGFVAWPAYAAVEKLLDFTLLMLIARKPIATWVLVILLLAIFIPVHISLWAKFPAWYHLVFFASLVLFPAVGAMRRRSR